MQFFDLFIIFKHTLSDINATVTFWVVLLPSFCLAPSLPSSFPFFFGLFSLSLSFSLSATGN
jgi:hypothetical protein